MIISVMDSSCISIKYGMEQILSAKNVVNIKNTIILINLSKN